jgi:ketosteroid isomerase-like protein
MDGMNTNDRSTPDTTADALAIELARVEEDFNQAMVSNDISRISACVADDWVLVTPEVGIVPRSRILHVIESGELSHDTMSKAVGRVRVYGDVAVVTGRGQNTGQFRGQRICADEWITDVYRKVDGRWLCVLTHLTPVARQHVESAAGEASPRHREDTNMAGVHAG